MLSDFALALDPVLVARGALVEPDPWQADLLRSDARQTIMLCSRQAGKSTVSSIVALHTAIFTPPALVLLLAPALRQAQEIFRKVKSAYEYHRHLAPTIKETELSLELANGSRVHALPGKESTIRGFSGAALLVVDEAARVPDVLYQTVRPMLAVSQGRILLLSTPWGKRGFFHQEWTDGDDWKRVRIPATICPRISPEWLEAERRKIPDFIFRQEYMCEFTEALDSVFRLEHITAAVTDTCAPIEGW